MQFSFPLEFKHLAPVLFLAVLAVVSHFFPPSWISYFDYDRLQFSQLEWWRIFSSHLLHTNQNHLLLNLGGLLLLWALHGEKYSATNTFLIYVVTTLFITLGIHFFTPSIHSYVGLSGMLHGLFIWGACDDIRLGRKSGYGMLIGAAIKITSEQFNGPDSDLGGFINATVAIDAHLYGILSGFIAYYMCFLLHQKTSPSLRFLESS